MEQIATKNESERDRQQQTLVIGDWVVDENWVTGIHRSETASRTGAQHIRSLHDLNANIMSLGGTGYVAYLLHNAYFEDKRPDEVAPKSPNQLLMPTDAQTLAVTGIGLWHEDDEDVIRFLFHPMARIGATPYRMSSFSDNRIRYQCGSKSPSLFNLAKVLKKTKFVKCLIIANKILSPKAISDDERTFISDQNIEPFVGSLENSTDLLAWAAKVSQNEFDWHGTNRIIRVHQKQENQLGILGRVDWQIPVPHMGGPSRPSVWVTEEDTQDEFLKSINDNLENQYENVVVEDLLKGVVSKKAVNALINSNKIKKDAHWFVSTKEWLPDWLSELSSVKNVEVVLFHESAAKEAASDRLIGKWITKNGQITDRAQKLLDEVYKQTHARLIVMLVGGWSFVARIQKSVECEDCDGVADRDGNKQHATALIQTSSMIEKLDHESGCIGEPLLAALVISFANSRTWTPSNIQNSAWWAHSRVKYARERLNIGRHRMPQLDNFAFYSKDIDLYYKKRRQSGDWNFKESCWFREQHNWNSSRSYLCCVNHSNEVSTKKLELWRAMTTLDGYICLVQSKREKIEAVLSQIREFMKQPRHLRKSIGAMLLASPGSGKTHLAAQIATAAGMTFVDYDLTSLVSRENVLDCFDDIVTRQARKDGRDLLVFVDEINAQISGHYVYDAFLKPLESGKYERKGKTYSFRPCVWLFAGTEAPGSGTERINKASDFVSRLTMGIADISTSNKDSAAMRRAENIYLGVNFLQRTFTDVSHLTEGVLKVLHDLPADLNQRKLRHFVESFEHIQYGRVTTQNIPHKSLEEYDLEIEELDKEPKPVRFVEIEGP